MLLFSLQKDTKRVSALRQVRVLCPFWDGEGALRVKYTTHFCVK
jgi:hypothetical protein